MVLSWFSEGCPKIQFVLVAPVKGALPSFNQDRKEIRKWMVEALTASEQGFNIATVVDKGNPG